MGDNMDTIYVVGGLALAMSVAALIVLLTML
jgi:hypothetical protein